MDGPTPGIRDKSAKADAFMLRSYAAAAGGDWKKRPRARLFAIAAKLCRDLVIRVVHEHLDIRLTVSRGGPGEPALRDPKRELVADLEPDVISSLVTGR